MEREFPELNPEQYRAVMHRDGPALVLAGAGTGKTRVVTYRVARLMETGIEAGNILLLTFTNKAAHEMMERAERLIGRDIGGLSGGTFHHVAHLILRRHHRLAGLERGFSIMDRDDSKKLFEECVSEAFRNKAAVPKGGVFCEISSLTKNTGTAPAGIITGRLPSFAHMTDDIERVLGMYEERKARLNLVDFDDLLLKWKTLFEENAEMREHYALKFRYILVDEYQDTNRLQSDIIDLLAGSGRNLMVVGDDAQSIYSFRGAECRNILSFPERYPEAQVFTLTTNYRSTPDILYLANGIIAGNVRSFRKELKSVTADGTPPVIAALRDAGREAEFVASTIGELNAGGRPLHSLAVLYRSHYHSMQIQMELQRRGLPFEVRSGLKFFEQAHIKDIIAYLRVIDNHMDEVSWKRLFQLIPGIGAVTARKLWSRIQAGDYPVEQRFIPKKAAEAFAAFQETITELRGESYRSSPSAAVDYAVRRSYSDLLGLNYPDAEARMEDIVQMSGFARKFASLEDFLGELALQGEAEPEGVRDTRKSGGRVVLSTVHQAKGLEWEVVFVIGMSDGRFPSAKSLRNEDEEEERRLFYVAATRARELLFLSYPVYPEEWNPGASSRPSRFLGELPRDSFEKIGENFE